jgi:hypothetical protein
MVDWEFYSLGVMIEMFTNSGYYNWYKVLLCKLNLWLEISYEGLGYSEIVLDGLNGLFFAQGFVYSWRPKWDI